ncbi:MAG: hypothetical protein PHS14_08600 [Elusimicrobia bacterium]|nr:hypothetical protein [Elusimicrobiota bacterium]
MMLPQAFGPSLLDGRLAPGRYVVSGPGDLSGRFLTALCPALLGGARVLWLDAGNSFNAYGAGYAARGLGADARAALARVDLARPFNLYQLETMVKVKVPERWRGEPVVIADPMPLFYDPDVPAGAARRVLTRVLEGMMSLPAAWLVLTADRPAPQGRVGWEEEWSRHARGVMRFYGPNFADDRDDAPGGGARLEAL